jgi:hypothetical protein
MKKKTMTRKQSMRLIFEKRLNSGGVNSVESEDESIKQKYQKKRKKNLSKKLK